MICCRVFDAASIEERVKLVSYFHCIIFYLARELNISIVISSQPAKPTTTNYGMIRHRSIVECIILTTVHMKV